MGGNCDLIFDGAGPALGSANVADISQQSGDAHIVGRNKRRETANAFSAGTISQPIQQFGAESAALPVVNDDDGNFGGFRIAGLTDVASDAQAAPVDLVQRAKRLVVVVVDLSEVAQLRREQLGFAGQEAQPAGFGTQPSEAVGQERSVAGLNLPYQDD